MSAIGPGSSESPRVDHVTPPDTTATDADGLTASSQVLTFTSGDLPEHMPEFEVVVHDRFLEPGEPTVVQRVTPCECLGLVQPLVEVDHQVHLVANRVSHGVKRREIVPEPCPSQTQLQPGKATLIA